MSQSTSMCICMLTCLPHVCMCLSVCALVYVRMCVHGCVFTYVRMCMQEQLSSCGLSFLSDESDTVLAYETKGKSSEEGGQGGRGHDPLMSALDNLNRVQQLEIIHG